ncbi:hypothetical protein F5Y18DRAFT_440116 [Xylariaceae sp. FL1019]|nr:hypothetical protein F5Y18DRAFT_440116 [Xylariaceae sp. FL1019]
MASESAPGSKKVIIFGPDEGVGLELEMYSRRAMPRFLFRGYSDKSGGGNKMLNGPEGIIPHAFLPSTDYPHGEPVLTMYHIEDLKNEVKHHCDADLVGPGQLHFSSWSSDFVVAASHAELGEPGESRGIAIWDTKDLRNADTARVYHCPKLLPILLGKKYKGAYPEEWLVYGPVMGGPSLRCVPYHQLLFLGFEELKDSNPTKPASLILARDVARTVQRLGAPSSDFVIMFTVALLCEGLSSKPTDESSADLRVLFRRLLHYLAPEIDNVRLPPLGGDMANEGLANPASDDIYPDLRLQTLLLRGIEGYIRLKRWQPATYDHVLDAWFAEFRGILRSLGVDETEWRDLFDPARCNALA